MADKVDMQDFEDDDLPHNTNKRYGMSSPQKRANVDIHDPLLLWLLLLIAAVAIKIMISNTQYIPSGTQIFSILNSYSNVVLQLPGVIALPLIIGAIIGSQVGERSASLVSALKSGLVNGIYSCAIYVVAVVIVYMVLNTVLPQFASQYLSVLNSIILPLLVFLLTVELFAAMAFSRKVDG